MVSILFSHISKLVAYDLELPSSSKASVNVSNTKNKKSKKQSFLRYGNLIFSSSLVVFTILAVTLIDLYIHLVSIGIPFIGHFMINARYAYIALYGVSVLMITIFRVYYIISKEDVPSF